MSTLGRRDFLTATAGAAAGAAAAAVAISPDALAETGPLTGTGGGAIATGGLPFDDKDDFADADRGFVAALKPGVVKDKNGRVVYDADAYAFLAKDAPKTADPSLWRQGRLVSKQGLYKVTDRIYQVRGLDLSNMTLVEGDTGVIVIDPLISAETAAAALALYRAHRGDKKVTALVYTHPHVDHFGGCRGVLPNGAGSVPVVAPEGFMEHAASENVYAGTAMTRRAAYMYGATIPKGPKGQIGCGLGQTISVGSVGLIPPTQYVSKTGQQLTLDGVKIEFQMTPGTEAPAEVNFLFPDLKALCMAENATHTMHNIITLRGAQVRDARQWSRYLNESIALFEGRADVAFASHHWPTWGGDKIVNLLSSQRDLYAYMHDQTLRLMNQGRTGAEIAEELALPDSLGRVWADRGYYGSLSHNVKGIYQRYMGWFDGNPAHLWEHPPVAEAERYVKALGGQKAARSAARSFVRAGDLRFAATLLNHCVFADPDDRHARTDLARVYEKLGLACENGVWRNFYLTGAQELREGVKQPEASSSGPDVMAALSVDQLADSIAIRVNGPKAQNTALAIDWKMTDQDGKIWHLILSNGALTYRVDSTPSKNAKLTLTMTKVQLLKMLASGELGDIKTDGDPAQLKKLVSLLDKPDPTFAIVTP